MRKTICILAITLFLPFSLFAQDTRQAGTSGAQEIENKISAVKAANPGDYILLPSGKRYMLTKEEIDIVNGKFDYDDLSNIEPEVLSDGTEIRTITEAHTVYNYPDGQSTHILKTGMSFSAFMAYIEDKYHIARFIDLLNNFHDYRAISSPRFDVFRASIEFQPMSNGADEIEAVNITAYNYAGRNYLMKYCSAPDMVWGNISSRDAYSPTGESRKIQFDVE